VKVTLLLYVAQDRGLHVRRRAVVLQALSYQVPVIAAAGSGRSIRQPGEIDGCPGASFGVG
jgi:hypothetical protein